MPANWSRSQEAAKRMLNFFEQWSSWALPAAILAGSIILALLAHHVIFLFARRFGERTGGVIANSLVRHAAGPTRWILPLLAIILALPALPVRSDLVLILRQIVGLGVIAAVGWVVILLTEVLTDALFARYRLEMADNLTARRVHTQTLVLRRIFNLVVIVVTVGLMLMTFPQIRQLGTSLLASAGIAGLVVGMAMKPTFSNLVAGLQIALTAPIRIEDVVVVEGEWGRVEEILTTYVVVRTWDQRRLIVPLSYFIEHSFQNWTRQTADLLTYVYIRCDYTAPVEELRQEFRRILESTPLWDKKVCVLQVTDASDQTLQIRALASASDSGQAFDLQCFVREKLIEFLQEKHPASLPKTRAEVPALSKNGWTFQSVPIGDPRDRFRS